MTMTFQTAIKPFPNEFIWDARRVDGHLPHDWREQLIAYTKDNMVLHYITPTDETSRELDPNCTIPTLVVSGEAIMNDLPWLYEFYRGPALRMMQEFYSEEELQCVSNPLCSINLQAAYDRDPSGSPMRYECHVDWAPTALLYVTTHSPGSGGELVVANVQDMPTELIADNCVRIYPRAGQMICMDARRFPHYVEPLHSRTASIVEGIERPFRLVVVMLYCTDETGTCPESSRPSSLDTHLGHQ